MMPRLFAGMPSVTLTDAASMRLETISFFLMVLLLSGWLIQRLWNYLSADFGWPRLSYLKALAVTGLWGLLFILVLTMISGARELMTPGAWNKDGLTYKLAEQPKATPPARVHTEQELRQDKLERLRLALWDFAAKRSGTFPPVRSHLNAELWRLPGADNLRYSYIGGLSTQHEAEPLAMEPAFLGAGRLVLLTSGEIRPCTPEEALHMDREGIP